MTAVSALDTPPLPSPAPQSAGSAPYTVTLARDEDDVRAAQRLRWVAIVQNDAAVLQMGDDTLKKMAAELVLSIRLSATIDWNLKESVRAAMRRR